MLFLGYQASLEYILVLLFFLTCKGIFLHVYLQLLHFFSLHVNVAQPKLRSNQTENIKHVGSGLPYLTV